MIIFHLKAYGFWQSTNLDAKEVISFGGTTTKTYRLHYPKKKSIRANSAHWAEPLLYFPLFLKKTIISSMQPFYDL